MEDTLTAPQDTGVAEETASKATETDSKESSQPQAPAVAQVEGNNQQPQAQPVPRARPSEFYGFRKKMGSLEDTIRQQSQQMQEMAAFIKSLKSPDSETQNKFDKDVFFTDPEPILSAREKTLRDQIEELRREVTSFKESQTISERTKNEQEALEVLFPKSSPDATDTLEERLEANQERVDKLMKLLKSKPALDMLFKLDPKEAVAIISEKLDGRGPAPSPTILPKKLMGGNKGGAGAPSNLTPKDQKRQELKRLREEMDRSPELRFDEKHKEKRDTLIRDLERLEKE